MIKLRDYEYNLVEVDRKITKEYGIKIEKLKEGEKISILSDAMFKTMFVNSKRVKYGAKLISYFVDISFEDLMKSIKFINSELDKEKVSTKNERCDYVAEITDSIVNIEVNSNPSIKVWERNVDYANKLSARKIEVGSKYNFTQVIQINLNNFSFKCNEKIVDIYATQNRDCQMLSSNTIFIEIFIPNLRKKCYTKGIDKLTEAERFILSLVETNIESARGIGMGDEFMQNSIDEQVDFCLTEDLREAYDHELAWKEEWRIRGLEEGLEKGRKEIIDKLFESGMTKKEISSITNISEKEIESILK